VDQDMPPKRTGISLSEQELATMKQWIETGADFPDLQKKQTEPLAEQYILTHIEAHARGVGQDAKNFRYFSMAHIYNSPDTTEYDLQLQRAALSKAINSLHRQPEIVLPVAVDPNKTVFALDLRRVGWEDPSIWLQVLQKYPFAL